MNSHPTFFLSSHIFSFCMKSSTSLAVLAVRGSCRNESRATLRILEFLKTFDFSREMEEHKS